MRGRIADAFAPELEARSDDEVAELLDVLEVETDPVVWRIRRTQQQLTTEQARATVERSILGVLRDAAAHPGAAEPARD